MPERNQPAVDLDQRLAEIDRTLRSIQIELGGGREEEGPSTTEPSEAPARTEHRAPPPPPEPPRAQEPPPRREPPLRYERPPPRREPPPPPREQPTPHSRGRNGPLARLLERAAREQRPAPDPLEQITALSGVHVRLLDSSHELLEAYQMLLEQLRDMPDEAPEPEPVELTVAAGPFMSLDAVRDFERALAAIPGVIEVAVRGYERGDRAVVEVQLRDPAADRTP